MAPTVSADFFMKVRRVMSFEDGSDEFLVVCDEFISNEFVLVTGGGDEVQLISGPNFAQLLVRFLASNWAGVW